MASTIEDAKRFLYLHPHATTAVDNPVELLAAIVKDFEALEEEIEEKEDDDDTGSVSQKLLAFIKGLRDDMKICEAEYQTALGLAKVC